MLLFFSCSLCSLHATALQQRAARGPKIYSLLRRTGTPCTCRGSRVILARLQTTKTGEEDSQSRIADPCETVFRVAGCRRTSQSESRMTVYLEKNSERNHERTRTTATRAERSLCLFRFFAVTQRRMQFAVAKHFGEIRSRTWFVSRVKQNILPCTCFPSWTFAPYGKNQRERGSGVFA